MTITHTPTSGKGNGTANGTHSDAEQLNGTNSSSDSSSTENQHSTSNGASNSNLVKRLEKLGKVNTHKDHSKRDHSASLAGDIDNCTFHHEDYTCHGKTAFGTRAIHAGNHPDPTTGAVAVPISLATTFVQRSPGEHNGYEYSRSGNPTRAAFECNIASIENACYALAFASGSAATVTIINMLPANSHVISIDDVYGGTNRYFNKVAAVSNCLTFDFVDFSDEEELNDTVQENTRMIWLETPTNPTLKITDIKRVTEWARQRNLITVVDNTFASPYLQNPLDLGADIVVHSVTKYLGGHSDVVMGVLATNNEEYYKKLKFLQNSIGAVPAPFDCYMALRGIKTLHIRMREHSKNALEIAKLLESHPLIEKVIYPHLPSHPQYQLALKQMKSGGGMVTFFLKGGINESRVFLENLTIFALAESLGAVESLAEHPAIMTHASVPAEHRKVLGISDSLIRLSVGIEDVEDLKSDILSALDAVKTSKQ